MRIVIVGDLVPTKEVGTTLAQQNVNSIFGQFIPLLQSANAAFFNLECVLTKKHERIEKEGPCFQTDPLIASAMKAAGFTHVGMANNHMKDYGNAGVMDSMKACKDAGLIWLGAGTSLREMQNIQYVEADGIRVGMYAVSDHEFSAAAEGESGANCFDEYETRKEIEECKKKCDLLIVLFHSGLERYPYPTPDMARRCRAMIRSGANYVICQHSHCPGTTEEYKNGFILYGQGNFIFPVDHNIPHWNESVAFILDVNKEKTVHKLIPLQFRNNMIEVDPPNNTILQDLKRRSQEIKEGKMDEIFQHEAHIRASQYFSTLLAFPRSLWILNKLSKNLLGRLVYRKSKRLRMLNIVQCETHRELLLECLRDK